MFYWFTWILCKLIYIFFFPLKVYGKKNIPKSGPFILACNHQSYLDPIVIPITTTRRLNFIARDTLFKSKIMDWILRHLDVFPIKRNATDVKAIRTALKLLKEKRPLLIFPEGSRKTRSGIKSAQPGIGLIAAKSHVPVIPVYVSGTDIVLPAGSKNLKRHLITITYGEQIIIDPKQDYQTIADTIMDKIYSLSAQKNEISEGLKSPQ